MITRVGRKSGTLDTPAALSPVDEADLVARCRAGVRAAHDEFYLRFRRNVAANLYRVIGSSDANDLDDLVQDVFVIAFRGLESFRGDARLSTWLYRICINVALGKIRSKSRRPPPVSVADVDEVSDARALSPETPERSLQRAQDRARVYRALEQLAPKKRIVLYLHEIEGLELKDIAYLVDSNPVTVRTRLFYARREFYKVLAGEPVDGADPRTEEGGS
jgi:RNA polymerase sigma-70 factor (ECF subfamily)